MQSNHQKVYLKESFDRNNSPVMINTAVPAVGSILFSIVEHDASNICNPIPHIRPFPDEPA